jgi:outer membrane lipoprotein-sorting protein
MKKIKLFLFTFLLTVSLSAQESGRFSAVQDVQTLKEKIRKVSENTQSIQSDFIQEKHLTMLEEVLISNGRFLFRKDNDVRWEYVSPIDYTIVIYKGMFSIKDDKKVSEFDLDSNPLFRQINNMIVTAIRGDFVDNPEFGASFFENQKQYLVKLVPENKQVAKMLAAIEIYFNRKELAVEQVRFIEHGDDYTKIIFKNRAINSAIPDKQFELGND